MTARSWLAKIGLPVILLLIAATGAAAQEQPSETDEKSLWEQVQELYENARKEGEEAPRDFYDWIRSDMQNIGDWEYHVFESAAGETAESVEQQLNELGTERWDCIWIEQRGKTTRFVMKRPTYSYLQHVPLSQLLKLIPLGGSGDE